MKIRHRHSYSIEADDGREFEVLHEPEQGLDVIVRDLPDGRGTVVGYLVRDEDASNPLEDTDGSGRILRFDGRDQREEGACLLGYDTYGERDEDIEPDPHAVLLDKYEHGLEHWYVATGQDYPMDPGGWDTSNGARAWVPDDACREHIRSTAIDKFLPGVKVHYESQYNPDGTVVEGRSNIITITFPDGTKDGGHKDFVAAYKAAAEFLAVTIDPADLAAAEREVAEECAESACKEYTSYICGDVWAVCVEVFDAAGERVEDDACWGHVGSEWAERALNEAVDAHFDEDETETADQEDLRRHDALGLND